MVSAERGGSILFELCRGDGVTTAAIRRHAQFMRHLRVTTRCLLVRYGGDEELWAEAAFDVLDCVTSSPDESGIGRRAARFMRACLGLDAEMGGMEQRMRELQNTQYTFPTSLKTLRDDRMEAMVRLCRVLYRINYYPCSEESSSIDESHLRAVRIASKFMQMFALSMGPNVAESTIDDLLKSFQSELPRTSANFANGSGEYEARRVAWNKTIEYFAKTIYADVSAILFSRGYVLRGYDNVMWSLRIVRKSGRMAVDRYRHDVSAYVFAACMAFVEELWFEEMREEFRSFERGGSVTPRVDRLALADTIENFIREKRETTVPAS